MDRAIKILLALLLLPGIAFGAETRLMPDELTYDGAFKLPALNSGYDYSWNDGAGYHTKDMTIDDSGYVYVHVRKQTTSPSTWNWMMIKSSVPALVDGAYNTLNTGTMQSGDETSIANELGEAPWYVGYTFTGAIHYMPAQGSQSEGKLYHGAYCSYCSNDEDAFNVWLYEGGDELAGLFFWTDADLSDLNYSGRWNLTENTTLYYAQIISSTPNTWASTNTSGKSLIVGGHRSGGPRGLFLSVSAPWLECTGEPINCDANPPADGTNLTDVTILEYGTGTNMLNNQAVRDSWNSMAWVEVGTKTAVIVLGTKCEKGIADEYYEYGAKTPYGCGGSGYCDSPCRTVLLFYDPDDFAEVVATTMEVYEPQPYAVMELGDVFYDGFSKNIDGGITYDSSNQDIYIRENTWDGNYDTIYQAVHVFSIADNSLELDATGPSAPVLSITGGTVTKTDADIEWTASTDAGGGTVVYELYRNGIPFLFADNDTLSYTDTLLSYYDSPVEYYVKAVDPTGNKTQSNSIFIDDSVGGNAPIKIFSPAIANASSQHDGQGMPDYVNGSTYSFTPDVVGGSGTYTAGWSISSFPSGFAIGSTSGEITAADNIAYVHCIAEDNPHVCCTGFEEGTCTLGTDYTNIIKVEDTDGNIYNAYVKIRGVSVGGTDIDDDGYTTAQGDADDKTINVHPGNPVQAAPTSLTVSSYTSDSVTVKWTEAAQRNDVHASKDSDKYWGEITYEVHWGTSTGSYGNSIYAGRAKRDSNDDPYYTITGLSVDEYFVAVKAFDHRGLESASYSNEVSQSLSGLNGVVYGTYYAENSHESCDIVETNDGGVAMVGWTGGYVWDSAPADVADEANQYRARAFLVKADEYGVLSWQRITGEENTSIGTKYISGSDNHWKGSGILETGTDDLIICGYNGTDSAGINGFLMKYTAAGTQTWNRAINGTGTSNDYLLDVLEKSGGGFAISGYSNKAGDTDAWLVLTDANGENATQTTYNTNGKGYDIVRSIRQTSDGGFIMVGYTQTGVTLDEDFYVVKTTSDGTQSWAQKYDNSSRHDKAYSVEEASGGNFWIFGRSQKDGVENTKIWIVEVNSSGVLQNDYEIGDDVDANAYIARNSIKLASGNFLIVGYTNVSGGAGYDGYLNEINTSGVSQWTKTIGGDGGNHEDYFQAAVVSSDTLSYYIVGTNSGAFTTYYDMWYLRLAVSDRAVENSDDSCSTPIEYYYDKDLDEKGSLDTWANNSDDICTVLNGFVLNNDDANDKLPSPTQSMSGVTISLWVNP